MFVCVEQCRVHLEVRVSHALKGGVVQEMAHWRGHGGEGSEVKGAALRVKTLTRPRGSSEFEAVTHNITTSLCLPAFICPSHEYTHSCCVLVHAFIYIDYIYNKL